MLMTKRSFLTGEMNTMEIGITEEVYLKAVKYGKAFKDAFPDTPFEIRQFMLNGTTPAEWENANKEENEKD